ncbi:MAG TPA: fused MFS/spermidine synthase [Vicinamibacterales bacterium]|nr:fused MFS/spermidine synthase [Vicinamibacterales bacterium]
MTTTTETFDTSDAHATEQWLPILLLLFVGSGCAALIYEIVWFQMLELFVGSSSVSIGVLLGTFMGGMCLGSFVLPRFISPRHHPLKVYALLEIAIGIIGLLLLLVLPLVGHVYTAWGGYGISGYLLRGLVASICLLPPTLAMGATLPAVARWVQTTPSGVSWLGFFYAGNIAGAVMGTLLAGFYLLRVFDMNTATYVAAAINFAVGGLGLLVAANTPASVGVTDADPNLKSLSPDPSVKVSGDRALVYVAIALSGFCALAAQVIWTRVLSLLFGASTYTFSLILAVFLIGLGIGSSVGSIIAKTVERPRVALGWCQLLNVGAMAWSAYMLMESLPYWPINTSITTSIWYNFQLDFVRAFWAVLPAPILWGASFPLALAAVARRGEDPGRLVGGVYAANTVGAIFGSVIASLILVYWFGSQRAQQVLMIVSGMSGLLLLAPAELGGTPAGVRRRTLRWVAPVMLVIALGVAAFLIRTVPVIPGILVAYGRYAATWMGQQGDIFYVGEGLSSSVAVSRFGEVMNYHNAGKVQASSQPQDMRLQRMLGHFTTLVPKSPKRVLVIGCGAGATAGAVSVDQNVESLTIAEIEPLVPRVVSEHFGEHNFHVVRNPKTHVVIDDARHFLLTTDEKFDAITSDPLDPWVKGAATLYTKEFFELAKSKLNPGGTVTLFVQLYESTPEAVKSEIGTFFEVFPNGVIWGNTHQGRGYDTVLMGTVEAPHFNVDEWEARLNSPQMAPVKDSLREISIYSALDLFANYAGRASDMKAYLADAQINRDRDLRLQYLAGLGLNLYQSGPIYAEILRHKKYPEGLFSGSPETMQKLREAIASAPGADPQ